MRDGRDIYWDEIETDSGCDLTGLTALVTGGSSGIGKAIAERYAELGADVAVLDIDDTGEEVAENIGGAYFKCDVTGFDRVQKAVGKVVEKFGGLDIVVNNAGYAELAPVEEARNSISQQVLETNAIGVVNVTEASVPHLVESHGDFVNIASIWGLEGVNFEGDSAYSMSKAGVIKYTEVVSSELEGVDVNSISPALVDTPMNDDLPEEAKQAVVGQYREGRDQLLQPEEVAEAAEFLVCSETDQKNVIIDAGYTR